MPRALTELFKGLADGAPRAGAVRATCALLCRESWHDLLQRPGGGKGGGGGGGSGRAGGGAGGGAGGAAVVQRGGVLDGMRWEEVRSAREGMLLLQRAVQAPATPAAPSLAPAASRLRPLRLLHAACDPPHVPLPCASRASRASPTHPRPLQARTQLVSSDAVAGRGLGGTDCHTVLLLRLPPVVVR